MEFEYFILLVTPYAASFALPLLNWSRSILQFRLLLVPLTTMELLLGGLYVSTSVFSDFLINEMGIEP